MTNLEDLIAFNDEVAALTRAGVPIEMGLAHLSKDPSAASNHINAKVARRVQQGTSLIDIFAEDNDFPPVYRSVVQAGLKCGRLPAALEGLSRYSRSIIEVRQSLGSAMLYPILVCMLAYALLVWSCTFVTPQYTRLFHDFGTENAWIARVISGSMPYWIGIPPILAIIFMYSWFRSDTSQAIGFGGWSRPLEWLPGVARIAVDQRRGNMAELLALLVEHEIPLHEGLRLASQATGDRRLTQAAQKTADATERGQQLSADAPELAGFPPFLRWGLTNASDAEGMARTLRLAAETYRQRAQRRIDWLRVTFPVLAVVFIGGGVTLLYCLSVFVPIVSLIQNLS
jgi:general secretion pathway protein F